MIWHQEEDVGLEDDMLGLQRPSPQALWSSSSSQGILLYQKLSSVKQQRHHHQNPSPTVTSSPSSVMFLPREKDVGLEMG
jgi:hypothetical protein